jgi:lipopolysaccharide export system permease protein
MKHRSSGFPSRAFRYIAGEFIVSFVVSFAFFFFVFFVNQLLLLAEDILQKDVPFFAVMRLVFFSLPSIIALSVPFATLVGTLMAVGRLSADNEIVALRASGFSLKRIFTPVLVLALILSGISFVVNDILLPQGTLNFGQLYRELLYANPALELDPHSVKRYQEDTLVTGSVSPGVLEQFVILDTDGQGHRRIIAAREARLVREGDPNTIGLELRDVVTHSAEAGLDHNYSTAEIMRYNILLEDITVALRSPGPREMSVRDVQRAIEEKRSEFDPRYSAWRSELALESARLGILAAEVAQNQRDPATAAEASREVSRRVRQQPYDRSLQIYRLEYHKKYSIPFAALSFVFIAFPLGLFSKRSGRGVGFGIGLLIATSYWALLIGGQTFGSQRSDISPALAMWLPNILFLVVGVAVFVKRMRQ